MPAAMIILVSLCVKFNSLVLPPKSGHWIKLELGIAHIVEGKDLTMMNAIVSAYRTFQCI